MTIVNIFSSIVNVIILLVLLLLILLLTILFYQINTISENISIITLLEIRILYFGLLVLLLYGINRSYRSIIGYNNYIILSSILIVLSSFSAYYHYSSQY